MYSPPKGGGSLLATILSCAGHAVLVFAIAYAVGNAGRPDQDAENPVEIEIIVVAAAAAAPQVAPAPVIEIELPPPLPDPVVVVEPPPVEQGETPPPPSIPDEPTPQEPPREVAEVPLEPVPEPKPRVEPKVNLDLPEPPPPPEPFFPPPPPVQAEAPLTVPAPAPAPPAPQSAGPDEQRQHEIARQKRAQKKIEEQRKAKEREEARQREREKARQAAQQQARAAAQKQAAQAQAGRNGSAASAGPRGDNSAMSIDAFRATVAARIARNRPANSTAAVAQGTVVVSFSVTATGAAAGIRIASSSGHGVLDQAALAAVRRAAPFPAPPPGAPRAFNVPMRFNGPR